VGKDLWGKLENLFYNDEEGNLQGGVFDEARGN